MPLPNVPQGQEELRDKLRLRVERAIAKLKASRAELDRVSAVPDNTLAIKAATRRHREKMKALDEAIRALDAFNAQVHPSPLPPPRRP
jgi:predicted phage gp36 major capsid-like protein